MLEPIRVLQVFSKMNRGGAETMIMNLYRNIDRSKIQFDFIVHTEDKCAYDDEIYSLGGKIYRISRYIGKNHLQYKKKWNNFFQNHPEYKIIHGHVRSTASIYLKIAKKYGLATIAHSHNTSSGEGLPAIVKNIFQYPIRYTADYLFACSKAAGEWLFGEKACKNDNFFILNNAIDVKKFTFNQHIRIKKRREFKIENKFVIGHIGRFSPQKNHDFLIDIFKEVYDRNKNSVLLLVGDGELRQYIEKKVRDLRLTKNVIFTGVRDDIPELLQAMDIFVFPSLYEGLPLTLIEAQASGLKCIASQNISTEVKVSDLIEFISLKKSSNYWADQILLYKNGYERRDATQKIINAGYHIEENAKYLEKFYINCIKDLIVKS